MAELIGPWQVVTDANGNAVPGALIGTFDAVATTTPKATYSDPELTTPHTNPVVADASGKVPQLFVDTGAEFYLTTKTAAGVLLEDYEFVTGLGDTGTGTFARDFDAGGRYELSGDLGVVSQEFGPPEGDDIGGSAKMSGWAGTQGDDLEIDFATVTFTGAIDASGFVQGGVTNPFPRLLSSANVVASASTDIALDASFDRYQIEIFDLSGAGGGDVRLRLSFDNGATYKDAADDYLIQGYHQANSGAVNVTVATSTFVQLSTATVTAADVGRVLVDLRSRADHETHVQSMFTIFDAAATTSKSGVYYGFTNSKGYDKATHIRIYTNTSTLTYSYKITGHP